MKNLNKFLFVFIAIFFISSCKKDDSSSNNNGKTCSVSKITLTDFSNKQQILNFNYDSNNNLNSVLRFDLSSSQDTTRAELTYSNNKLTKIIYRNISANDIYAYDSLIYNGSNQLTEIKSYEMQYVAPTNYFDLINDDTYSYNTSNKIIRKTQYHKNSSPPDALDTLNIYYNTANNIDSIRSLGHYKTKYEFSYNANVMKLNIGNIIGLTGKGQGAVFSELFQEDFLFGNNLGISSVIISDALSGVYGTTNFSYTYNTDGYITNMTTNNDKYWDIKTMTIEYVCK